MPVKTLFLLSTGLGAPAGSWALTESTANLSAEDQTTVHPGWAGTDFSSVLKPGVTVTSSNAVAGDPETAAPPSIQNQFGWFSTTPYNGTFSSSGWVFNTLSCDNRAPGLGHSVFNVYRCTTQDFTGVFTFLFQAQLATLDWWTGGGLSTSFTFNAPSATLSTEFLFINVWCHETNTISAKTHRFSVGSSATSFIVTSNFTTAGGAPAVSVVSPRSLGLLGVGS